MACISLIGSRAAIISGSFMYSSTVLAVIEYLAQLENAYFPKSFTT
jgi:hypothetical protein